MNREDRNELSASFALPMSRRSVMSLIGLSGAALAGASGLVGCSPTTGSVQATSGPPVAGGVIRIGINGGTAATKLDPHAIWDEFASFASAFFFEGLNRYGEGFKLDNVLAEALEPNADATVWRLRLKQDVEFHNGKTLSSADVAYSIRRILDPASGAFSASSLSMLESVKEVNERDIEFHLNRPTGWFDEVLAAGVTCNIIPTDWNPEKPVTTGPFKLDSHRPGVEARFTRFDNYHSAPALLDGVVLTVLGDSNARVNALKSGQVDAILGLPPNQVKALENQPGLQVTNIPSGSFGLFWMRVDEGITADVRVREALRLCIDRDQIVQVAFGGYAKKTDDLYAFDAAAYDHSLVRQRNVEKARALIQEAGVQGQPLVITTRKAFEPQSHILAANAKEVGLTASVNVVDDATFNAGYNEWPVATTYFPAMGILPMAAMTDGPGATINSTRFSDLEYNELFNLASAAISDEERLPILKKMQRILFERGGYIIPARVNTLLAHSKKTTGWPKVDTNGNAIDIGYALKGVGFSA